MKTEQQPFFVVCVDDTEYSASLERRKIYQVLSDEQVEAGQCRPL